MRFSADFDTLIERFSPHRSDPLAIAVSGGSDSLALLYLAHDWALRVDRTLLILTVDHQLRSESADEALAVSELSSALGHRHETLVWAHPQPGQATARRARYELLANAAREHGARVLLTGHTFDDVVETAMIRRRRGVRDVSIAGPALAAPVPAWPQGRSVTLVRPLIGATRSAFRKLLQSRGQSWVDDPSNLKLEYERVRVRQFLARHPQLAGIAGSYVRSCQVARSERQNVLARELIKIGVDQSGLIDTGAAEMSSELLRLLMRCASGTATDARETGIRQLLATLTRQGQRQTLGGAWVQRAKESYLIGRDPAAQSLAADGEIFDGRFIHDPAADLPPAKDLPFLVRQSAPPGSHWRELISERLAHLALCYQTPLLNPVQT